MLITFGKPGTGGPITEDFGFVLDAVYSTGNGLSGADSIRTTAAKTGDLNNGVYLGFARQHRTGTCGVWANGTVAGASDSAMIEVWQGDAICGIRPSGSSLQVWTVNGGVLHTESSAISGSFKRFELQWTVSSLDETNNLNYDGAIELRINETVEFTAENIQLGFALADGYTRDVQWNVVLINPHGDLGQWYLTDESGEDNTGYLPSNVNIYNKFCVPGNGTYAEMTPSTGTDGGAMLDESVSDGSTTYLSVSTDAKKATFNHQDFSSIGSQRIYGVKQVANARKLEPGYRRFRPAVVLEDQLYYADTEYGIGIGYYNWCEHVWERNPRTGQRWTLSQVNDAEFGGLLG